MADSRFYQNKGPFSLRDLSVYLGAELVLPKDASIDQDFMVQDVASLDMAQKDDLGVFNNRKYAAQVKESEARVCIMGSKDQALAAPHMALLIVKSPTRSFAEVAAKFYPEAMNAPCFGTRGAIDPTAKIADDAQIGPYAVIGENVEIGSGTTIGPFVSIGSGVRIGNNCQIHSHVSITHAEIGNSVAIYSGAQIGRPGFGFVMDEKGPISIPQIGRVVIHDLCEIGANSCVDRGSAHDTILGMGTRLDNLVQIAHNVQLGKGCIVVAQAGIAGSTKVGDYSAFGGQVGISGHINIGSKVQVAAQSGVMRDISDGTIVGGTPAVPVRQWHKQTAALNKLVKK